MRLVVALALLAAACAPSKKQLDSMQTRLAAMEVEQDKLRAQLEAVAAEQRAVSTELDQVDIERREDEELAQRIKELEELRKPVHPGVKPGRPDPAVNYQVLLGDAQVRGPDTALVTVVEWADFQCPFCARVQVTLKDLDSKYQGRVRFVFKHNPLPMHNRAMVAAIAAEAAGRQGKFWKMHDLLFSDPRNLSDEQIAEYAKKLKLNRGQFKRDRNDPALKAKIEAQQKQGSTLGATGTPAFFVNGRFLSGAQPAETFSALIDAEMERAQKRVADGTPATSVYEVLMAEAVRPPF